MMGLKKNQVSAKISHNFSNLHLPKKKVQLTDFMTGEYKRSFSASCSVNAEGGRSMTPTFCNTVLEVK